MTTLTTESPKLTIVFPAPLIQKIRERNLSNERLTEIILQFVDLYLNESNTSKHPFKWSSGKEFAERLIANNRQLFEELARL